MCVDFITAVNTKLPLTRFTLSCLSSVAVGGAAPLLCENSYLGEVTAKKLNLLLSSLYRMQIFPKALAHGLFPAWG